MDFSAYICFEKKSIGLTFEMRDFINYYFLHSAANWCYFERKITSHKINFREKVITNYVWYNMNTLIDFSFDFDFNNSRVNCNGVKIISISIRLEWFLSNSTHFNLWRKSNSTISHKNPHFFTHNQLSRYYFFLWCH